MEVFIPDYLQMQLIDDLCKLQNRHKSRGINFTWKLSPAKKLVRRNVTSPNGQVLIEEVYLNGSNITVVCDYLCEWEVIARLDHIENGSVAIPFLSNGERLPESATLKCSEQCDHCGVRRNRTHSYLLRKGEEVKQIGSSCVSEFTGGSVSKVLTELELRNRICVLFEEYNRQMVGSVTNAIGYSLKQYIAASIAIIRKYGFVSIGNAVGGKLSTLNRIQGSNEVSDSDLELAEVIQDWGQEINPKNDFECNLRAVARASRIEYRYLGFIPALVNVYMRAHGNVSNVSTHMGKIGEILSVEVFVRNVYRKDSYEYMVHSYYMVDVNGNEYVWNASSSNSHLDKSVNDGSQVKVTGKVKGYTEINGVKRTKLTRCKIN